MVVLLLLQIADLIAQVDSGRAFGPSHSNAKFQLTSLQNIYTGVYFVNSIQILVSDRKHFTCRDLADDVSMDYSISICVERL